MVVQFSEITFLTDTDLSILLAGVPNDVLQHALYDCDSYIKTRVFIQFSNIGFKTFELDRAALHPPSAKRVQQAQKEILLILKDLIEAQKLKDYPTIQYT